MSMNIGPLELLETPSCFVITSGVSARLLQIFRCPAVGLRQRAAQGGRSWAEHLGIEKRYVGTGAEGVL
jgi:hypothetical protein